jgi:hypothetical protein
MSLDTMAELYLITLKSVVIPLTVVCCVLAPWQFFSERLLWVSDYSDFAADAMQDSDAMQLWFGFR